MDDDLLNEFDAAVKAYAARQVDALNWMKCWMISAMESNRMMNQTRMITGKT